jgi:GMP synthase-like glutamine amidotransferase
VVELSAKPGVVLQNEDAAPAALLGDWLRKRGLPYRTVPVWEAGVPEDPRGFAWVAALGAEDSVTQAEPAWVPAEIEFLRRAVDADVPVLGLCFGGQALSAAVGGEISPAEPPSIGWLEIETGDPDVVPAGPWAHFNREIFSVPAPAEQLARSPRGPGAIRLGPHLGLQFHPEATPAVVNRWAEGEAGKLASLGIDPAEIRAQGERWGAQAARRAFDLFDAWRRLAPA